MEGAVDAASSQNAKTTDILVEWTWPFGGWPPGAMRVPVFGHANNGNGDAVFERH